MGKLLSLGTRLKYPITISKLLKQPGDAVKRQESILQYKFTTMKTVGDPFGEEWEEEQTTIADWDSPAEGTLTSWKVHEGETIRSDLQFVDIEETCPHTAQFAGLCVICGKDMTQVTWASTSDDTDRATINMIHDQTLLKVSASVASKTEEESQRRLLKNRKLSLVVDLDQTIIHACIEPTVGDWQDDPNSPNHEAVKDVAKFQLKDEGVRGLASGCWYYIKMRPGLKDFLSKIAEMYELHVYTMGTRAYAMNIAKIVDPERKLFGDRIISRDENGNITTKSLARLFPVDTKMVVIIDDRADVWPKNRPNLIKVTPYDFFLGIGDINSSFLPKREELPAMTPALKKKHSTKPNKEGDTAKKSETATDDASASKLTDQEKPAEETEARSTRVSALEELVRMGGGDDQALRLEQAAEQEKFLEKQLTERPLLHMQEKLEQEEEEEEAAAGTDEKNGDATQEHPHHKHNLLKDDDIELMYLEKHLTQLHNAFYDEYDRALITAHGGRVAQLKPGHNKKVSIKDDSADLKIVPDIGNVMTRLKAKTLTGCTIVMSGLVPLQADIMRYFNAIYLQHDHDFDMQRYTGWFSSNALFKYRTEIGIQAASFGAEIQTKVNRKVTHLVASTSRTRTTKVRQAAKYPQIKIVNQQWLLDSMSKWEKVDETPYLVHIHEQYKSQEDGSNASTPRSIHDFDESTGDSASEAEESDVPASQEETADDTEGVMPDEMEDGGSPIDKNFDWGSLDNEIEDFLNTVDSDDETDRETDRGDDNDSGVESETDSDTRKRKFKEDVQEDSLSPTKRQKHAEYEDDLEADLMAEFDAEDDEEEANGAGG